jgi:hypothetical protein
MLSRDHEDWIFHEIEFLGDIHDPDRSTGPWVGHRWFAYDLIVARRPKSIVELGTHYGVSFLSMCQAVMSLQEKDSICLHAIDTWEGEPHAGIYGPEVFDGLNRTINDEFGELKIRLHKKFFTEALKDFDDNSIDLLHIDGFHSYDALKDDFESWLPKLSRNGIVLLHDVDQSSGYGSANYYDQEILGKFPTFRFRHNFGLGVVFPKGIEGWEALIANSELLIEKYHLKATEYMYQKSVSYLDDLVVARDEAIKSQSMMIDERDQYILQLESKLKKLRRFPVIKKS